MVVPQVILALAISIAPGAESNLLALQRECAANVPPLQVGGGLPGKVSAFGSRAVVLGVAPAGASTAPILVAANYGKGRVAAMSHGVLWDLNTTHPVMKSLGTWLRHDTGTIGVLGGSKVPGGDFKAYDSLLEATSSCSALILSTSQIATDSKSEQVLNQFVLKGGGLLVLDTPWGWLQLNPGKSLRKDHPAQRLLAHMGIGFSDGFTEPEGGKLAFLPPLPEHHVAEAYSRVRSRAAIRGDVKVIGDTLMSIMRDGWQDEPQATQIRSEVGSAASSAYPRKGKPIQQSNILDRLAIASYDAEWRALPPSKVVAHPGAADYPGSVPGMKPGSRVEVEVGGKKRTWWSTGQYAAPSFPVSITLPPEWKGKSVQLRIGGHSDSLWHLSKWERYPSIDLEVPVVNGKATANNPFGGMVYLVCNQALPKGKLKIEGAAPAPVYFLGKTSATEWLSLRNSPAPWAEIVGNQSAICVPSEVVRKLDDPAAIAKYFDEMVTEAEKFFGVPLGTTEHRFQADRQISAGYMHSGYPIMTWLDVQEKFVDIKTLRGKDGSTNWGFYHELGHNYQESEWTWNGWGETTNNLFSIHCVQHFNGHEFGHPAMSPTEVDARLKAVFAQPGAEAFYEKDPWFGLTFWEMFRREFGFAPMTTFFTECRSLKPAERPRTEQDRKDLFAERMSRILGKNVVDYMKMWGIEVSPKVVEKCQQYPKWLPKPWRS